MTGDRRFGGYSKQMTKRKNCLKPIPKAGCPDATREAKVPVSLHSDLTPAQPVLSIRWTAVCGSKMNNNLKPGEEFGCCGVDAAGRTTDLCRLLGVHNPTDQ
ncbi:hypothetical protein M514_00036 [Trichuris suis]|uniref:Uncharacterized protein n=1 Tax=Trichuris suis TaxID=68888 RepID=A0A085NTV0_9BILA|nr:hypothetical protein M513_00036 [Trichuris suis]KFD72896.1 hypothetical protein M514_00036 [Trichuris suis]